jgi:uncharacterized membrane protein
MNASQIKLALAVGLFLTWVGLVFAKSYDPSLETGELISAIKEALVGLGIYHTMDLPSDSPNNTPDVQPTTTDKAQS